MDNIDFHEFLLPSARKPLSKEDLILIEKKLRPIDKDPFIIPLPPPGNQLTKHIVDQLKARNIYREGLKVREISNTRIEDALAYGTDRNSLSILGMHAEHDEEEKAIKESGLYPKFDIGMVTFVSNLDSWSPDRTFRPDPTLAILIYYPDNLRKIGNVSNGLHRFIDERLIGRSLLAVFGEIPKNNSPHRKYYKLPI